MKIVDSKKITELVSNLCIKANINLRKDVLKALKKARFHERTTRAKNILSILIENANLAKKKKIPICQDTGLAIVFVEIGQGIKIKGDLTDAINEGVKKGYEKAYLRNSVVSDPILRSKSKYNIPAVIHYDITTNKRVKISVMPKGFGSENKSKIYMLLPTAQDDIIKVVLKAVTQAGPDACPPFIVGIGIGGTLDKAVELSKKALLLPIGFKHRDKHINMLSKDILMKINLSKIGPLGMGGKTTALGVNILTYPTHIAGLPVAVNISCHALRSASGYLCLGTRHE